MDLYSKFLLLKVFFGSLSEQDIDLGVEIILESLIKGTEAFFPALT